MIIRPEEMAVMRRMAEKRMVDTIRVSLPGTDASILDPDTGLPAETPGGVLWTGPCRLRLAGGVSGSAFRRVGADTVSLALPILSVPVSAPRIPIGAICVITAVPPDDPAGHTRLNLRLRVSGLNLGTEMTSQRMSVEVVTG